MCASLHFLFLEKKVDEGLDVVVDSINPRTWESGVRKINSLRPVRCTNMDKQHIFLSFSVEIVRYVSIFTYVCTHVSYWLYQDLECSFHLLTLYLCDCVVHID